MKTLREIRDMRPWQGLIANCIRFAEAEFQANVPMWSVVTSEEVKSQDMFHRSSTNVYTVKREHFPTDPDLKYIHMNTDIHGGETRLTVELTMLDFGRVQEHLNSVQTGYELVGRKIHFRDCPIMETVTRQYFGKGKNQTRRPRTQVKTLQSLTSADPDTIIDFFDMVWGHNLCCEDWKPTLEDPADLAALAAARNAMPTSIGMQTKQIMSQELQQKLEMCMRRDQVPLMALAMHQTLRMVARMAQNATVLQMNNTQLRRYLESVAAQNPALEVH